MVVVVALRMYLSCEVDAMVVVQAADNYLCSFLRQNYRAMVLVDWDWGVRGLVEEDRRRAGIRYLDLQGGRRPYRGYLVRHTWSSRSRVGTAVDSWWTTRATTSSIIGGQIMQARDSIDIVGKVNPFSYLNYVLDVLYLAAIACSA